MKKPHNVNTLERAVNLRAKATGMPNDRTTRYIAYNSFCGVLALAKEHEIIPMYLVKGGVALELRLGTRARASQGRGSRNCSTGK